MPNELKPCPFCGGKGRLNYRQTKYYGENEIGAKKIKFTGYIVCNKCRSRGKPVSVVYDKVDCMGWVKELREILLPLTSEDWNRRADNG